MFSANSELSNATSSSQGDNWILYDGDCFFCDNYVKLLKLKQSIGFVRLLNARENPPELRIVKENGVDLNQGMVFHYKGELYHGAQCVHMLALLSSSRGWFNQFNAWVFSRKWLARILYPILRFGRNLTLRLMGKNLRFDNDRPH
ncbi:MAG: DCC1-like thiol-disulfide oxidoreductase family protein [Vampirovibrionales bacterium]|nr:DCC1-like thiol-disulfide oxidoreductase family protein [Vampirovibrionales bacterium]